MPGDAIRDSLVDNPSGSAKSTTTLKDNHVEEAKVAKILEACRWKDLETLRELALSESGLVSDELRRQACWSSLDGLIVKDDTEVWRSLPQHADEMQVKLDVDRSFIYYPDNQSPSELDSRKADLFDLIVSILRTNPYLCYFQGYHDIAQVFLLVMASTSASYSSVARLSVLRIRDFMLPNLSPALAQLRLIPSIIHTVNAPLYYHLSGTQPFFALSGTLTMYAHDIQSYSSIARLFDALLSQPAVFSVYMFAAIVLARAEELFEIPSDEPEMLHSVLSKLPQPLDLEKMISDTSTLFARHPPETLDTWRGISRNSVLKTTRWTDEAAKQSLNDGETLFRQQCKELAWAQRKEKVLDALWKYRRPAGTIGMAVLIGVLSFYLRKSHVPINLLEAFWKGWHRIVSFAT